MSSLSACDKDEEKQFAGNKQRSTIGKTAGAEGESRNSLEISKKKKTAWMKHPSRSIQEKQALGERERSDKNEMESIPGPEKHPGNDPLNLIL
jgi:hypothetical protein